MEKELNELLGNSDITVDKNGWEKETKKNGRVKTMFQLVDPYFYEGFADILTLGAQKYKPNNWMDGNHTEYSRAVESHWNEYKKGNQTDKESGKSHLYHIACNIMFLDYFDRKEEELEEIKATVHENMTRMNLESLR